MEHELVNQILGKLPHFRGYMLSGSKSIYRDKFPDHTIYFNACIFNEELEQIWWGDIDYTLDKNKLHEVANEFNITFYITRESPYRFDGLTQNNIKEDKDILTIAPNKDLNGKAIVRDSNGKIIGNQG